jgi:hypothetical protein
MTQSLRDRLAAAKARRREACTMNPMMWPDVVLEPVQRELRRLREVMDWLASGGSEVDEVLAETALVVLLKRGCRR